MNHDQNPSQMSSQISQIPKIDLTTFFLSISSAALIGLGVVPHPETHQPTVDLPMAKQNIDLLELMSEKTVGNRTSEEDKLLQQLLMEVRLRYVEKIKQMGKS